MPIDLENFHFLRPEFLLLFFPVILVFFSARQLIKKQSSWHSVISPHLLKFLMASGERQRSHVSFWLTTLMAMLIVFAISGPSFREKTIPVFQTESARVVLLDLSLSMDATDIKPARIERARHKIMDLLEQTKEGTIGLVVYAGDAFIISPLTSDSNTIASMVPTLSPQIMPVLGSRPDIGIAKAVELLNNAKTSKGQIIWITDGIDSEYIDEVNRAISTSGQLLSIVAVGTEQGAPIPLPNNRGFLKDTSGNIILPKLDIENLQGIARQTNGQYIALSADSSDVEFVLSALDISADEASSESDERINRWIDDGYWLCWPILLLMMIRLFRRSEMTVTNNFVVPFIAVIMLTSISMPSKAGIWDDLWKSKNQQANEAFKNNEFDKAAKLFEDPSWQAASAYRNGDFDAASSQFSQSKDLASKYNLANSLAKSQQLEAALELYQEVIDQTKKQSLKEDSEFNKKIIEQMLEKQKQEQEQDQQDKDDKEQQEKNESDSESESQQNSEDKSQQEQQSEQESQQSEQNPEEQQEKETQLAEDERDQNEKDQALEHWLEKIPDDPGGLLRRKMILEYQKRGRKQTEKKRW
jgi:Ca-activated chloride channel family protein